MKIKLDKKKYISVILIFLTLGSTLAYGIIQAFTSTNNANVNAGNEAPELPSSNVVDYEITATQRNYMLRLGIAILEYRYKLTCTECANQRSFIESAASQFSDQIFVEELVDGSANNSTLSMTSHYGSKLLTNPSSDDIFDALCELMTRPPVACATRGI